MGFCPVEELMVWRSRFKDLKKQNFSLLTTAMGFGPVKHYCWRLEFQARGARSCLALVGNTGISPNNQWYYVRKYTGTLLT